MWWRRDNREIGGDGDVGGGGDGDVGGEVEVMGMLEEEGDGMLEGNREVEVMEMLEEEDGVVGRWSNENGLDGRLFQGVASTIATTITNKTTRMWSNENGLDEMLFQGEWPLLLPQPLPRKPQERGQMIEPL
ncbi:hypothetical protein HAX54_051734 [Datura stramonium]|uniref:Uncharacterized protein n=1 Tax=Datura stramonium TaxID=4076 RepID=A0ABS8WMW1_DATST|nr:hypothetical protein [Datura stramonium]